MKKKMLADGIYIALVLLWTYAAFSKLFTYEAFRFQLLGHKILMAHASLVAWLVPGIELLISILLMVKRTRLWGLYASLGLLAVFTVYIIYMFNFYPNTPCSCSGFISLLGWKSHIVFNLFFTAMAGWGIRLEKRVDRKETDNRTYSYL